MEDSQIPFFEVKNLPEVDEHGTIQTVLEELRSLKRNFEKSDEANKKIIKTLTDEVMALRNEVRLLRDPGLDEDTSLLPPLPFVSLQDFKEFDTMLLAEDDMRAQLKAMIQRLGAKDFPSFLRMALKTVISDHLAVNLTWRGTNEKPSIKLFTCLKLIKDICHSKYSHSTELEINKICQQHFLHARDRVHKKRKLSSQET